MALLVNPRLQLKTSVENGKLSIPDGNKNFKITTDKESSSLSFTNNAISEEMLLTPTR